MKIRTLLVLLMLLAMTGFAVLNWGVFMAPSSLSLGVATVQAPLGLVMLGMVAVVAAVFLVFVVYLQTTVLLDARVHARELRTNRELADKAEASRFTELRNFLATENKNMASQEMASRAAVLARLDLLERDLRLAVQESANSLSACIGELDDRLEGRTGVPR